MGTIDIDNLMAAIDTDVARNRTKLEDEISTYIADHEDQVAQDIASQGLAEVPTFAGKIRISEDQLLEVA